MITTSERERIQFEVISTEELLSLVKGHPTMSLGLEQKIEELKKELDGDQFSTPRAILYFFGDPVKGSMGIDVDFLSAALSPFQKIVTAKVSTRWHGHVKGKGQMKRADDAKLFLTALPRGSFGVELTKLTNNHVYHSDVLDEALRDTVSLISSAKSTDDFSTMLGSTQQRELSALRQFFRILNKANAGIKLESGNISSEFSTDEVKLAYEIVATTKTDIDIIVQTGTLRGILLESWQFDFVDDNEKLYHGSLHSDMSDEQAEELSKRFNDEYVRAYIERATITMRNGEFKESYKLKNLENVN